MTLGRWAEGYHARLWRPFILRIIIAPRRVQQEKIMNVGGKETERPESKQGVQREALARGGGG